MIQTYRELFSHLHTSNVKGLYAPHKAVLLLGILDLIEFEILKENKVFLTEDLYDSYAYIWKRYVGNSSVFRSDILQPFWYMKSEPFWQLNHIDGTVVQGNEKKPTEALLKTEYYGEIDTNLFLLLQDISARAALRVTLIAKYMVPQANAVTVDPAYIPTSSSVSPFQLSRTPAERPSGIYVHLPDGSTLYNKVTVKTLIKAVQLAGPEQVAKLGIICCGIPLVSKQLDERYGEDQEVLGGGYYLMKKNGTDSKVRYLNTITKAFNLGWVIEYIP